MTSYCLFPKESKAFIVRNYGQEEQISSNQLYTLDNGLRVYLLSNYESSLSTLVLAIRAGVAEETPETNGYFHLLEHCLLFRQNNLVKDNFLMKTINEHGMYYNAQTEQDLMFFEICLPGKFLDQALGLLKEVVFNFDLTEEAMGKEKNVILRELEEIERDPQKLGLAKVYELVFPESGYGLPPFGNKEVIREASLKSLREVYSKYFCPENSALVIIGNFDPGKVKEAVSQHFSGLRAGSYQVNKSPIEPRLLSSSHQVELTMNVADAYLMAGLVGPNYNQVEQYGINLLVEILGRGLNPLLYAAFAGYPELVYSARINYLSHARCGLIFLSAVARESRIPTARRLLQNFFIKLSEMNYSPKDYLPDQQIMVIDFLNGGKNRITWSSEKYLENPINLGMGLAKYLLLADENKSRNYLTATDSLTSSDLRKIAYRFFNKGKPVWVIIKPEKK